MNEIFDLLLNAEKANKLIENLAGYVVYIYPGIITIYYMKCYIENVS